MNRFSQREAETRRLSYGHGRFTWPSLYQLREKYAADVPTRRRSGMWWWVPLVWLNTTACEGIKKYALLLEKTCAKLQTDAPGTSRSHMKAEGHYQEWANAPPIPFSYPVRRITCYFDATNHSKFVSGLQSLIGSSCVHECPKSTFALSARDFLRKLASFPVGSWTRRQSKVPSYG